MLFKAGQTDTLGAENMITITCHLECKPDELLQSVVEEVLVLPPGFCSQPLNWPRLCLARFSFTLRSMVMMDAWLADMNNQLNNNDEWMNGCKKDDEMIDADVIR